MTYFGREHPLRDTLDKEIRARPFIKVHLPERVSHLAVLSGEQSAEIDRLHLESLCNLYNQSVPPVGATHFIGDMGPFRVRWERHTEFSTYTFLKNETTETLFEHPVITYVPKDWLQKIPGQLLTAVHLELEEAINPARDPGELNRIFKGNTYIGCEVAGGAAICWTDLRIHDDRFVRILVKNNSLNEISAGRLIQRLLEIETYRVLALLSLPLARESSPRIRTVDEDLALVAAKISGTNSDENDSVLLTQLSSLSTEIESIAAKNSYRFGATKAYYGIVQQRLDELRLSRLEGLPTLSEFIKRRLTPAMKTCDHTAARQEDLSKRVSRIGSLLRVRVEVELEKQNQKVLESTNKRIGLQLRLQETVEGLSVVAISYYLIDLLAYSLRGAKAAGLPLNPDVIAGTSVPFVVFFIWYALRKARNILTKTEP